jgi:hypothetical protein
MLRKLMTILGIIQANLILKLIMIEYILRKFIQLVSN